MAGFREKMSRIQYNTFFIIRGTGLSLSLLLLLLVVRSKLPCLIM